MKNFDTFVENKAPMQNEYYIRTDYITFYYPYETPKVTQNLGVLEEYRNKSFSRNEIDKIIAEMVIRHPYVENSMRLNIIVECKLKNRARRIYHDLKFINENYKDQQRGHTDIKFEF